MGVTDKQRDRRTDGVQCMMEGRIRTSDRCYGSHWSCHFTAGIRLLFNSTHNNDTQWRNTTST